MKKFGVLVVLALLIVGVLGVQAQDAVELRMAWYDDGSEGTVLRDLLDRFEADNPDIKVVVDTVPYQTILDQLPLQVEAGEALRTSVGNGDLMERVLEILSSPEYQLC